MFLMSQLVRILCLSSFLTWFFQRDITQSCRIKYHVTVTALLYNIDQGIHRKSKEGETATMTATDTLEDIEGLCVYVYPMSLFIQVRFYENKMYQDKREVININTTVTLAPVSTL